MTSNSQDNYSLMRNQIYFQSQSQDQPNMRSSFVQNIDSSSSSGQSIVSIEENNVPGSIPLLMDNQRILSFIMALKISREKKIRICGEFEEIQSLYTEMQRLREETRKLRKQNRLRLARIERVLKIRHRRSKKDIPVKAICPFCFSHFGTCQSLKNHLDKTHEIARKNVHQNGNEITFHFIIPAEQVAILRERGWNVIPQHGLDKTLLWREDLTLSGRKRPTLATRNQRLSHRRDVHDAWQKLEEQQEEMQNVRVNEAERGNQQEMGRQ